MNHGRAYYNEIDPFAAQWLRNLIAGGHIAPGDVDERSIVDVKPDDLRGYAQCHFFAGIGGWSYALRLAGWPDDRPVWTGSCPCQPFSAAGAGKAADDERHLWPQWFPLIRERRPATVFGEQVEAAIGWGWLDLVFADLEAEGYACGASVLPACSIGAPHIRNRVWFVADALRGRAGHASGQGLGAQATADGGDRNLPRERLRSGIEGPAGELADSDGWQSGHGGLQPGWQHRQQPQDSGSGELADAEGHGQRARRTSEACGWSARSGADGLCTSGNVDNAAGARCDGTRQGSKSEAWDETRLRGPECGRSESGVAQGNADSPRQREQCGAEPVASQLAGAERAGRSHWDRRILIPCSDGNWRPVPADEAGEPESPLFPLAHGVSNRVGTLRGSGNAIVPQAAAEFIKAFQSVG